jgi:hypothetical protein
MTLSTLQCAALLVVRQDGYRLTDLNLERWAQTYRCSPDEVLEALKIAENGSRKLPEEIAVASSKAIPSEEVEE